MIGPIGGPAIPANANNATGYPATLRSNMSATEPPVFVKGTDAAQPAKNRTIIRVQG